MFKLWEGGPIEDGFSYIIDLGNKFEWGVINFIEGSICFLREEYFDWWGHILITGDMFFVDGGFIENGNHFHRGGIYTIEGFFAEKGFI